MKNFLITIAIKGLIKLLELAIDAINNGKLLKAKTNDTTPDYDEDLEINPKTAKMFAKFIKSHTKEEKDNIDEGK